VIPEDIQTYLFGQLDESLSLLLLFPFWAIFGRNKRERELIKSG